MSKILHRGITFILLFVTIVSSITFVSAENHKVVNDSNVELFLDTSGKIFSYHRGEKINLLKNISTIGNVSFVRGINNGLIQNSSSYNLAKAYKTITNLDGKKSKELFGRSTISFKKIYLLDAFNKLPNKIKEHLNSYGSLWARPLMDMTLEYVGNENVGHKTEKYNKKIHLLIAKYFFGENTKWLGVYYNTKTSELVLCEETQSKKVSTTTKKPTIKPTVKPTIKPTATPKVTPKPTKRATATPRVTAEPIKKITPTPKPIATPRVSPEPERPGSNGDSSTGANPIAILTAKPIATPRVTPEPSKPSDNNDSDYGNNPLESLNVTSQATTQKTTTTPKNDVAVPKVTPEA